ncbi:diaminobutyrate acetyltransferase [Vibrio sp. YMD68]|uniref:diaminobutyrate acetyltransferase n=1 Tax=Vibrio sp. YMD68 TaxID=3042300 RepID=UPI00249A8037|nr:diaminobutyrate acetyltransferase [Vibrio sp. YMD68]WGV99439.1 diaminobutyrate acetyltransferase [Vibrio sp. YMD68]
MNMFETFFMIENENDAQSRNWSFRAPVAKDGLAVNKLIESAEPLDDNSAYCNFLQATHFRETSLAVCYRGELAGFISAYLKPNDANTLFIWQVVVDKGFRGQGIAKKMLNKLLERQNLRRLKAIETTITKNNKASWALFNGVEKEHGEKSVVSVFLDQDMHFDGQHDTEYLYRISLKKNQ